MFHFRRQAPPSFSPLSLTSFSFFIYTLSLSLLPSLFPHSFSLSLLSFLSHAYPVTNSQPLSLLSSSSSVTITLPPLPPFTPLSSSLSFLSFRFPFSIERDFQPERWSTSVSSQFHQRTPFWKFQVRRGPFPECVVHVLIYLTFPQFFHVFTHSD